jgi:hypothetical protein
MLSLNLHHLFVATELTVWIFFIFQSNKIRVRSIDVVSSLFCPRCRFSFGWQCHDAAPCHVSFPWSQDELDAFASSSGNASSRHLPSRAKTEALNLNYHRRPPSLDSPTPTLHCYKKEYLNIDHFIHHSIASLFYLILNHSTTSSELHLPPSFPFTVILRPSSLRTITSTVIN